MAITGISKILIGGSNPSAPAELMKILIFLKKMIKFNSKKTKLLLGIPIAILSLKIYLGTIFGYFFAKFLAGKIGSIVFNMGNYKLHFHHWMIGLIGLIFVFLYNFSPLINHLTYGFFGGLIFEGISNYSDWHKILNKKITKTQ